MKHLELDNLSLDQLADKLINLVSPIQGFRLQRVDDENIAALRWAEDIYRMKSATSVAMKIIEKLEPIQSSSDIAPWDIDDSILAKLYFGCNETYFYTTAPLSPTETLPHLVSWLNESESNFIWTARGGYESNISYRLSDCLNKCSQAATDIVRTLLHGEYYRRCLLETEKAKRDYREEKDRCKKAEWEDHKHKLKNENIDKLKANHFGKYFYDYATYADRRFIYALVECYKHAAIGYLKERGVSRSFDIYQIIDEFFYLQAMYCLLHNEDPVPPCFRKQDQPAAASSPAATAAEEGQQPTVSPEERKRRLDLYVALAQTSMKLPDDVLQDIRKVFDPGNEKLWGKIAADRQNPIPYTDNDHTNLTPFFNLLGVLIRKGLPEGEKRIALLDKLPNNFHSDNKVAIKTAVTNGSRKKPKPLARSIEHRLDQQ